MKLGHLRPGKGRATHGTLKGDEDRRSMIVEGIKTKVQEFLPHSQD